MNDSTANQAGPSAPSPEPSAPQSSRRRHPLLGVLLLGMVGTTMFFVGHVYGEAIGRNFRQLWHDLFGSAVGSSHEHQQGRYFTCGMHPWVMLPSPGLCPICHMDLTPLDASKLTTELQIDPVMVQNIGVRTAEVEMGPLVQTVRTVGKVDYDETSIVDVNLKVGGWIETLHVDFLGAEVQAGQPLFELYSPELFAAQQEYLSAWAQASAKPESSVARAADDAQSLLAASRTRLRYFGIDDAQIAELERVGAPQKTMTMRSPSAGTVIKKMATTGMRVDPGMQLYRIADLHKVWVIATAYEYQLPFVALGQAATMSLAYVPGQQFEGRVTYVYPWADEKTREIGVRLEFDNAQGLLKPGMFVTVELRATLAAQRTLVGRSAVLDTGRRQVAFVSLGHGRFEPRDLRLGLEVDGGMVEVLDGLKPGEKVVTSGQFLLDSESKLREALRRMVGGDLVASQSKTPEVGAELASLPPELAAGLRTLLGDYLQLASELAADRVEGLASPARGIAASVAALLDVAIPDHARFWQEHEEVATVRGKALQLVATADLGVARLAFSDLSVALAKLLRATGVPNLGAGEVQELHCPMFQENQGGSVWLQAAGPVRNPYFGSKMLGCFDRRQALPAAGEGRGR